MTEIRRFWALGVGVWLLLAALAALWPGGVFAKPLPPVSVLWNLDTLEGGAGTHRITLTLNAVSPARLSVSVRLPGRFQLLEGPSRWEGDVGPGTHTLVYTLSAPGPGAVTLSIQGKTASNVHFAQSVVVHVGKTENTAPAEPPEPSPSVEGPGGVREHWSR